MLNAETKRHIDAARDVLVGVAPNPMTQIDQITYALIYKFMDDMDQSAIKAGGEPSFFTGALEPYAWSKLVDSRMGSQEKMNLYGEALQMFAEAKQLPELFRDLFRSATLPYRKPETLGLFLKEINFFDYTHPEDLGNAYEYLLSIMSAQGEAGQFRTPRHIIDFIVDVINPTKNDTILDPACGTGGFLVASYNHILEQHDGKSDPTNREKPLTPDERKKLMNNFEGYDLDEMMARLARVNMYLHQFKNPKIFEYDSLTNDDRWGDKFDVILANPPFMSPKGGIKPHSKFALQSNRSEVLFVDYIAHHLKPSGRAGIIVPEGILFKTDKAYRLLRKNLIEGGLIAVISLPSGVFKPYSGVKTSILILNKDLAKNRDSILRLEIANDGFSLGDTRRPITLNDLPNARKTISDWMELETQIDPSANLVSRKDLLEDPKHLLTNPHSDEESLGEFEFHKLSELITTITPPKKIPTSELLKFGKYPVIDQSTQFIAGYTNDDAAVIFPEEPLLIFGDHTCATKYVDFPFAQGADGIKILKFSESVMPKFANYVLRGKPLETAGYQRHFSILKNYDFPVPPLDIQAQIVDELDGYAAIIDGARKIVDNWKPKIDIDPDWDQVSLNDVADVSAGNSAPQGDHHFENGTNHFFRTSDVGAVHLNNSLKSTRDLLKDQSTVGMKRFSKGTILFPKSGASTFLNHRVMMGVDGYVSSHLATIKAKVGVMEDLFLYYCLIGVDARSLTADQSYPSLRLEEIGRISVPNPPMATQKEVVAEMLRLEDAVFGAKNLSFEFESRISSRIKSFWN